MAKEMTSPIQVKVIKDLGDSFILFDNDREFKFCLKRTKKGYPIVELIYTEDLDLIGDFDKYFDKIPSKLRFCKNIIHYNSNCYELTLAYILYCYLTGTTPICCDCYYLENALEKINVEHQFEVIRLRKLENDEKISI